MAGEYADFLDKGQTALREGHAAQAVIFLGQAMLAGREVAEIADAEPIRLSGYFDKRSVIVTHAAELAMPRGMVSIRADRVRAERLLVGKKRSARSSEPFAPDPSVKGLNVVISYPFGGSMTSLSVWEGNKKNILNITTNETSRREEACRAPDRKRVAILMDWAITEGSVVPVHMHGKRSSSDRLHAVNLFVFDLFFGRIRHM